MRTVDIKTIGFIGLGVMGEPICRHLVLKSGRKVFGYDVAEVPFERLGGDGLVRAMSTLELSSVCDVIFLALPSGEHVQAVVGGDDGLIARSREGQIVVDLGTTSVATTHALAEQFAARQAVFVDAPIARTRQAAIDADLSVMVGAAGPLYETLLPLIRCFASDVTACGAVGHGQIVKILNNMVLTETVVALAEALTIGQAAGVDADLLFKTLAKGSADSFALRNHGMKALLPGVFPERAFSARYMQKDIDYALALARDCGQRPAGAELANGLLARAIAAGDGDRYWPVLVRSMGVN